MSAKTMSSASSSWTSVASATRLATSAAPSTAARPSGEFSTVSGASRQSLGGREAGAGRNEVAAGEPRSEWGAGPLGPHSPKSAEQLFSKLRWRHVSTQGSPPGPRSGAAAVVHENRLLLYGGYGGVGRLEDIWSYDFETKTWIQLDYEGPGPGARENNGVVVMDNYLYVFGGYNGFQWLNDLHQFDLIRRKWRQIEPRGAAPSSRFGYVSAAYHDQSTGRKELILFAGYDGTTWLNDMNVFDFRTCQWSTRQQHGEIPSIRSCPSWARYEDKVYVFGGYDGVQRMNDFWELDLKTSTWSPVRQRGSPPSARYFHSSVVYKKCLFVYGGYNGSSRLGDLYCFHLERGEWTKIEPEGEVPAGRSSLVLQVYGNSLWLLGGYNGREVLNDLYQLPLDEVPAIPPTLVADLSRLINNKELSDVTFVVENQEVYAAAAVLACRSEHFYAMLYGGMRESQNARISPIPIPDIEHHIFLLVLEYLYTDDFKKKDIELDDAVSLLIAGERFLLKRLKNLCVEFIRDRIAFDNVVHILLTSYRHNAQELKAICLDFIVANFAAVRQTPDFAELKREPDLLYDLLLLREQT